MNKLMKIFKNPLFTFIIGGILFSSIVVIAESINSNEVLYDNSRSVTSYDNVQDVLDDVYNIINHSGTGFSLLTHNPSGLSTELVGGLYRYQGVQNGNENVDNYICFGTTNKSNCVSDTDKYMYRIIGINTSGQMKLIKKEALNTAYQWHSTQDDTTWPNSDLFTGLNGSYFLTNTTYVPNGWENRIVYSDWHYGKLDNANKLADDIYEIENSFPTNHAKIGLLYLHDFYYTTVGGQNCGNNGCQTTWMRMQVNDATAPDQYYEFTITRTSGNTKAWTITLSGSIINDWDCYVTNENSVRPVFFLNASERIASGSGTLSDPYILS